MNTLVDKLKRMDIYLTKRNSGTKVKLNYSEFLDYLMMNNYAFYPSGTKGGCVIELKQEYKA